MSIAETKRKVGGITWGAFPWWVVSQPLAEKVLVVVEDEDRVLDFLDDGRALFRLPPDWHLPARFPIVGYSSEDEPQPQVSWHEWAFGKAKILVVSREGLSLPSDPLSQLAKKTTLIRPGLTLKRPQVEEMFALASYSRNERVDQIGEYCIRGDVIDIWPAGEPVPIRLMWNFDTVESLRVIDLHTQRSEAYRTELMLYPMEPGTGSTLMQEIPAHAKVFVYESTEPIDLSESLPSNDIVYVGAEIKNPQDPVFSPPPTYSGKTALLKEQLLKWHDEDWQVAIFCHNEGERDRLDELLEDTLFTSKGMKPPWLPPLIIGELEHGFLYPERRWAVLANSEIFGRYRKRLRLPKFEAGQAFSSPFDLQTNDYLVHEKHGVGRYMGLQSLKVGKVTSEFLALEYKGGDKLYVPIFELQQVQKYVGSEGKRPALSSLDTAGWERMKSKVKEDVAKLAAELLKQAAKRKVRPGFAFPSRAHLEEEFAKSFRYQLTPDQIKTMEEVETDMVSSRAMDRLICGDVGYGKTEIALRAAFKAASAGKQVCFLCPTTILAEQHYRNFQERLADYPLTTALLSRFQTPQEQKTVLAQIVQGSVDIVIGTHRLLSNDVAFKDLGLLIIDEEHRFGVKQKNKILGLRETVDVLSLTATPIPRTLSSAIGGLKDLSIIETPPEGRLPISTHVGLFDEDVMVKAVQEELDRGGQVFYVHNRVKTLLARKEWLQSLLPSLRIGMAHGQMKEHELEEAMYNFLHKKIDVLLATTIIESGLDIPSVNTLVVEEAEEMGLAQLYQLRGRVGRSPKKAYCYLFYNSKGMSTDARKRLEALKEHTALGSGFRLAMRDMEIRGAGNLLGPQQHGDMMAVGLDTYSQLLQEEIQRLKGAPSEATSAGPIMELSLSSYIPNEYLPSESERIYMYKRILNANKETLTRLKDELVDRCGPLPEAAQILFDAAALRLVLKHRGVSEIHQETDAFLVYFDPVVQLPNESVQILVSNAKDRWNLLPGNPPGVRVFLLEDGNILDSIGQFIRTLFPNETKTAPT